MGSPGQLLHLRAGQSDGGKVSLIFKAVDGLGGLLILAEAYLAD